MRESSDEGSVEVAKTQKRADILNFGWPWPISYPLYFYGVHACHPLFNDYPQIIYSRRMEDAFLWLEKQVISHRQLQYFRYTFDVVVQIGAGGDRDVVHVLAHLCSQWFPFVDYWSKNPIHHCLECRWGVKETEKHHCWFPQSVLCFERCLVFVAFLDSYVVVPPLNVQLGEDVGSRKTICEVCDKREGVLVFDGV